MRAGGGQSAVAATRVRRAWADFVRTDLELGFTLLDKAAVSGEPKRTQKSIRRAMATLRTADVFLADRPAEPTREGDIRRRGDELRDRLGKLTADRLDDGGSVATPAGLASATALGRRPA